MIAFPEMLVNAARQAEIDVPANLDKYENIDYPHWHIYCTMQLGAPMPYASVHYDNAKVVASLSNYEALHITAKELREKGFQIGYSS